MKLKGADDYFAREVTIEGESFRIVEWSDDLEQNTVQRTTAEVAMALGLTVAQMTDPDAVRAAAHTTGADMRDINRRFRQMREEICAQCVVGWSLSEPCTPENVRRLPSHVLMQLSEEIARESNMMPDERDF